MRTRDRCERRWELRHHVGGLWHVKHALPVASCNIRAGIDIPLPNNQRTKVSQESVYGFYHSAISVRFVLEVFRLRLQFKLRFSLQLNPRNTPAIISHLFIKNCIRCDFTLESHCSKEL